MVATVSGALVTAIVISAKDWIAKRRRTALDDEEDLDSLTDFLFDAPPDARTRAPGHKGWTTKVDDRLKDLEVTLGELKTLLDQVLYELLPNGGSNFRASVERMSSSLPPLVRFQRRPSPVPPRSAPGEASPPGKPDKPKPALPELSEPSAPEKKPKPHPPSSLS